MLELSIGIAVAALCASFVVVSRWYFSDKAEQRKELALERVGLPVAVFSQLEDFRKRLAVIESQSLSKMR